MAQHSNEEAFLFWFEQTFNSLDAEGTIFDLNAIIEGALPFEGLVKTHTDVSLLDARRDDTLRKQLYYVGMICATHNTVCNGHETTNCVTRKRKMRRK